MNDTGAHQFPVIYQARPGHGKGFDGTRGEPSIVSVPSSSASSLNAGSRHRPSGKRASHIGPDGEDKGHKQRSRAGKNKASNGPKKVVHCPFEIRYPQDPKFISCPAFDDWGRLREHLLDRRHKPRDRCQRCGRDFYEDVEWNQHTSACKEFPSGQFERPICVEREQVPLIRRLTRKGRQTRPLEDLWCEAWTIIFETDDIPDRAAWLMATPSQNTASNSGLQNRGSMPPAPPRISNQSPPQAFSARQPGFTLNPGLLQRTDTAPVYSHMINNSFSASPTYSASTAFNPGYTESFTSERTTQGSSFGWPSDLDTWSSQYSFLPGGNELQNGLMPVDLDNLSIVDGNDWDYGITSNDMDDISFSFS